MCDMRGIRLQQVETPLPTKSAKRATSGSPSAAQGGAKRDKPSPDSVSLVETVVDNIRGLIGSRQLVPGQRLIESDIRTLIGASRATIREAMGRLETEGLVVIEHQKGARVRRMTAVDAQHLYEVREVLEGAAARLAAKNVNKKDYRRRLRALEEDYRSSNDDLPSTYFSYNEKFHRLIVEMSENPRLIRLVAQLQHSAFLMLIQVISDRKAVQRAYVEHKPIVAAIFKGDEASAERAMRAHVRRTGGDVVPRIAKLL